MTAKVRTIQSCPNPDAPGLLLVHVLTSTLRGLWPLVLLGMAGCSSLSSSTLDTMKLAVRNHLPDEPTAAQVDAIPYAQLEAKTAQGHAVLVLGTVDGSREAWYGKQSVIVFTEHGHVVQTTGLVTNLDSVHLPADDPFARGLQTMTAPLNYERTEDWSPGYRYGVTVEARLIPLGRSEITILGKIHDVVRVDEQVRAPAAGFHAVNHYWVDASDGFIWKSEQHVMPGLTLTLVALRPYHGDQP
jgi:hypothetical protein